MFENTLPNSITRKKAPDKQAVSFLSALVKFHWHCTANMWYNFTMKKRTSYTLSENAKQLLAKIAAKNGISRTAMLEILIREKAKQEGVQ